MSTTSNSRTTRSDGATWMIYGANGYTGLRIARQAKAQGMRPVLAGRNPVTIKALADELDLPWVAFDLNDASASQKALKGITVVAHCAGPYSATSAQMLDACIASGCHYVDLCGEIDVMVAAQARDAARPRCWRRHRDRRRIRHRPDRLSGRHLEAGHARRNAPRPGFQPGSMT